MRSNLKNIRIIIFILGVSILTGIIAGNITKESTYYRMNIGSVKSEITLETYNYLISKGYNSIQKELSFSTSNALMFSSSLLSIFLILYSVFFKSVDNFLNRKHLK